ANRTNNGGNLMRSLIYGMVTIVVMTGSAVSAQAQIVDFRNSSNSPHIYSPNGEYLGNLNNNQFDPNSVSNPFGAGSQFRSNGVNNPFSPNYMPGLAPRTRPFNTFTATTTKATDEATLGVGALMVAAAAVLDRYSGCSGDFVLVLQCCHAAVLRPTAWTS